MSLTKEYRIVLIIIANEPYLTVTQKKKIFTVNLNVKLALNLYFMLFMF